MLTIHAQPSHALLFAAIFGQMTLFRYALASEHQCCMVISGSALFLLEKMARPVATNWLIGQDKESEQMSNNESVVAVYHTHGDAEAAVKELQHGGIDMHTISIVAKDYHTDEQVVGYYNAGDRMKRWGKAGAFWGGFWGLLFGSAFFAIPGLGPLLVAGPLVAWIVGALEGAVVVGGLSALGAGLFSVGVPKDSVLQYELAIKNDKYLLIVNAGAAEIAKAKEILDMATPAFVAVHSEAVLAAAK